MYHCTITFILKQTFEAHKIYDIAKLIKHTTEIVSESIETQNKKTETKKEARKVHGNSDKNCDIHQVYEIYAKNHLGAKKTLKYGITSQCDFKTKEGNPRPEYQVKIFKTLPEYTNYEIFYHFLNNFVEGRIKAKALEQRYVSMYYAKHKHMPEKQLRPLPDELKK